MVRVIVLGTLCLAVVACHGSAMTPSYARSAIEPVSVKKLSNGQISLRYRVLPKTAFHSGGVNDQTQADTLRVVIDRCGIRDSGAPMATSVIPLDDTWQAEVHLPYDGGKVVLVHADGDQQV